MRSLVASYSTLAVLCVHPNASAARRKMAPLRCVDKGAFALRAARKGGEESSMCCSAGKGGRTCCSLEVLWRALRASPGSFDIYYIWWLARRESLAGRQSTAKVLIFFAKWWQHFDSLAGRRSTSKSTDILCKWRARLDSLAGRQSTADVLICFAKWWAHLAFGPVVL